MSLTIAETGNSLGVEDTLIPGEILAAIAAAATVFIGSQVRVGSVEQLHAAGDSASRWSQQGRSYVQASHNLRQKTVNGPEAVRKGLGR